MVGNTVVMGCASLSFVDDCIVDVLGMGFEVVFIP